MSFITRKQWAQFVRDDGGEPIARTIQDLEELAANSTEALALLTPYLNIDRGGTGASTQQDAIDNLAGVVTSGFYLRGDGTHVTMSALQAADITGVLTVPHGGTGIASLTSGRIPFGAGTGALQSSANLQYDATGSLIINGAPAGGTATDKLQVNGDSLLGVIRADTAGLIKSFLALTLAADSPYAVTLESQLFTGQDGGNVSISAADGDGAGNDGGNVTHIVGNTQGGGGVDGIFTWKDQANTSAMTFAPVTGLFRAPTVRPSVAYQSVDGTAGVTFAATPIATLTVKNGLVVAHT